jgi:hypothetical protein
MDIKKEKFQKMFPNLAKEISKGNCKTKITSLNSDTTTVENLIPKRFTGYSPDVIDYIRRCDKTEQAEEIICYLMEREEIGPEYAKKLMTQLKTKGVRSFGSKKENDYYLKQDGL